MRDMYYSSQPMEIQDKQALECTFRMINAETQLLYSSDYPHWDFDLPSTIYDLPFLSEKAKHNILGGTAARLFKLPPRNEKPAKKTSKINRIKTAPVRPPPEAIREGFSFGSRRSLSAQVGCPQNHPLAPMMSSHRAVASAAAPAAGCELIQPAPPPGGWARAPSPPRRGRDDHGCSGTI